ncbi:MAG: hypothetical protein M1818_005239 [Claussenomyces sp. TS43310]|nr:MAG: hypothetical protein M1818_005239 [Claussenomyces sp. TS43310]
MSDSGGERPRRSLEFVETSTLETIIPAATTVDIEEVLNDSMEELNSGDGSPSSSIAQRRILFFDETVDVYVVLRTGYFDEHDLRSYLNRLAIVLEARVLNSNAEGHDGPAQHETIYLGSVSGDPLVIVRGGNDLSETEKDGSILVIWKLPIFLARPMKLRLQGPLVIFSATASLRPPEQVDSSIMEDEYLPSMVPSGINLLESFSNDPAFGEVKPRLSALRVSRVTPPNHAAKDALRPLKNYSHPSIRIAPALSARVRYTRANGLPPSFSTVASLDIDISSYAGHEVGLETVNFDITEGVVEDLNGGQGMALPIRCLPRDDVTLLYRLRPDDLEISKSNVKPVKILIVARVKISSACTPLITLRWVTSVDFTAPINPSFTPGASSHAIQRDHRPTQLSISSNSETVPTVASLALTRPDALPSIDVTTRHQRSSSVPDFGVTTTFTAPSDAAILPGKPFSWEVFIVNRSDRSRKLALVVIPRRRRAERINTNRPPSTSYGHKDPSVADAVLDDNILHAMQKNAVIEPINVVCLSTDVRIGPLSPSACHTAELRFMALRAGVLGIDAVRVVDLGTQEHVDIRDLPSIVVGPASNPSG